MAKKHLYKSEKNKVFSGIIGGIGEYFDIDPVILRLVYVILVMSTGVVPGVLVYVIALFIIPEKK